MSCCLYSKFSKSDLTLRDNLAIDRTAIANERTLLAYIRTALAVFLTGGSLLKFFDLLILKITGGIFLFVAIILLVVGSMRFIKMRKELQIVSHKIQINSEY